MARDSAAEEVVVRRSPLRALLPRFDEAIQPEFYRFGGKVRVAAVAFLIAVDLVSGPARRSAWPTSTRAPTCTRSARSRTTR